MLSYFLMSNSESRGAAWGQVRLVSPHSKAAETGTRRCVWSVFIDRLTTWVRDVISYMTFPSKGCFISVLPKFSVVELVSNRWVVCGQGSK